MYNLFIMFDAYIIIVWVNIPLCRFLLIVAKLQQNEVLLNQIPWFSPYNAGPDYIWFFFFLLAHQLSHFIKGKDKMWHQSAIFENS